MNEEAELVLENVELFNLSPGALSIQVANVEFKNIKINGPCNCEQTARKLTLCPRQPRMDPTRFNIEKRYCEEMTKNLVNALTCQVCATINLIFPEKSLPTKILCVRPSIFVPSLTNTTEVENFP